MIAAPIQCDVDGIPKGSHYVIVPPINRCEPRLAHSVWLRYVRVRHAVHDDPWHTRMRILANE
jgi:hypothetical protein